MCRMINVWFYTEKFVVLFHGIFLNSGQYILVGLFKTIKSFFQFIYSCWSVLRFTYNMLVNAFEF